MVGHVFQIPVYSKSPCATLSGSSSTFQRQTTDFASVSAIKPNPCSSPSTSLQSRHQQVFPSCQRCRISHEVYSPCRRRAMLEHRLLTQHIPTDLLQRLRVAVIGRSCSLTNKGETLLGQVVCNVDPNQKSSKRLYPMDENRILYLSGSCLPHEFLFLLKPHLNTPHFLTLNWLLISHYIFHAAGHGSSSARGTRSSGFNASEAQPIAGIPR